MYRQILPLLLCHAVAGAPKALSDSDITYVKVQPPVEAPAAPKHARESRIENLPLTIPGILTLERTEDGLRTEDYINNTDDLIIEDKNTTVGRDLSEKESDIVLSDDLILPESSDLSEITALPETALIPDEALSQSETKKPEDSVAESEKEKSQRNQIIPEKPQTEETLPEQPQTDQHLPEHPIPDENSPEKADELIEAHNTDTIPAETSQSERRGRNYESSETTDIFEEQTNRYEDVTLITEAPRTKPKFIPKLSYFKPQVYSFSTNSLEKATKRRFRSNCRCEKIWNCPKLQISVPRCPNEYFLCCF